MANGDGRGNPTFRGMRQAKINIDLNSLESAVCPICGAVIFDTSFMTYKRLPAIQSPNGKAQLVGVPIIVCAGCEAFLVVRGDEITPLAPEPPEPPQTSEPV